MSTPDANALARPTGLTATAGNTQVTLTWTDPGDDTIFYYEYQQKEGLEPFGEWTEIRDSGATTTSYRFTGLRNDVPYSYRLRALTTLGEVSLATDAVTATPQGVPPAVPVLTAEARHGGVTLTWPNPVDASVRRYEYQYRIGTGIYQPWREARGRDEEQCRGTYFVACEPPYVDIIGATMYFPVAGLANDTEYTFRIRAVNPHGTVTSNEASATPVAGVPAKPTGVTTYWHDTLGLNDRRILTWDRIVDDSILRYEYTTDEGRTWSLASQSGISTQAGLPEDQYPLRLHLSHPGGQRRGRRPGLRAGRRGGIRRTCGQELGNLPLDAI